MYQIHNLPSAQKELAKLPRQDRQRMEAAISKLADDPRPHGAIKLKGREEYRIRVGNYRAIYSIDDNRLLVLVIKVGHRRDVYN